MLDGVSLIPSIWRVSRRAESDIKNLEYRTLSDEESSPSSSSESLLLVPGGGLNI